MAVSKSKRNPKSKPKSKGIILGEDVEVPIRQEKPRLKENIFYTGVMMVFAMVFIAIPFGAFFWEGIDLDPPVVSSTPDIKFLPGTDTRDIELDPGSVRLGGDSDDSGNPKTSNDQGSVLEKQLPQKGIIDPTTGEIIPIE